MSVNAAMHQFIIICSRCLQRCSRLLSHLALSPCVSSIALVFVLSMVAFVVMNWRARVVFHSNPVFLISILVGAAMVLVGVIAYATPMTATLCSVKLWMFDLGLHIVLGALLVKVRQREYLLLLGC